MNDLSVTDVQKMLRMYAENGHDVISDPRAVLIGSDRVPYRMPAYHSLYLTNESFKEHRSNLNSLESHFQQTERPIISTVQSVPKITKSHVPGDPFTQSEIVGVHYNFPKMMYGEESHFDRAGWPPKPAPGIWVANFPDNSESAMHKALQEHTSKDIDHEIPKDWNMSEAHTRLGEGIPAFSNLVSVRYPHYNAEGRYEGHKRYVYNPSTEQLHSITDFKNQQ